MTAALIMWVIVAVLVIQGTILSLSGEWIWQLASADSRSENVGVEPIVVPELKFRGAERLIFGAYTIQRPRFAVSQPV
jgi:hypothetical protein